MQQFSNFNKGITKFFSFFLGQEGQLLANGIFLPDYFFEGDAVWQETLVSAQGRGRMPSFLNDFKSLWLDKKNYNWMKYRSGSLKDLVPDHYQIGYVWSLMDTKNMEMTSGKKLPKMRCVLKDFSIKPLKAIGRAF